ncbi:MAG: MG2 domain-containing protein [Spirochaetes bacterium]|nr:MG2 domain-containing protein [Spirochaetota bacterium]
MRRTITAVVAVAATLSSMLVLGTCSAPRNALRQPDPQVVQSVTAGVVSRKDPIRVAFTQPVAEGEIGAALERSPFRFVPRIRGTTRWIDDRTLEFASDKELPAGRRVRASVDLEKLAGFDFVFTVVAPSYSLEVGQLETADDSGTYQLSGTIQTSDHEPSAKAEQILSVRLASGKGKTAPLPVAWSHDDAGLVHSFTVTGITRAAEPCNLELAWSGKSIEAKTSGHSTIAVPSLGTFEVLSARVPDGEDRVIEVVFSDPLRALQNLAGLVRIAGRDDVRLAVVGNLVRLFTSAALGSTETVTVEPGVSSESGGGIAVPVQLSVTVKDQLPQVRFAGMGVILPTTQGLTVPVETMNLRAVVVEAFQVYGDNMTQFLQVNAMDESEELHRVGKVVWREVIPLGTTDAQKNTWVRHGLDLTPLLKTHPDGMFQLRVTFRRPHVMWACSAPDPSPDTDWSSVPVVQDDPSDKSFWDYYDPEYQEDYWDHRNDPCHPGYYVSYWDDERDVLAVRNVLVSDIGLIVKAETNGLLRVYCTDLRTAQPLAGVSIELQSFQRKTLASAASDASGMATFSPPGEPAFVVASYGSQHGYLKVDGRSALVTSHFDTGGEVVKSGVKGFLYGERGVWRPGDTIHLTFVLWDPLKTVPAAHPVNLELRDARGQTVTRLTRTTSVDGFYDFTTATDADSPTGAWEARVRVGDRTFTKTLKVETVMPNRLKVGFELPEQLSAGPFKAPLTATWLHGAVGADLDASVTLRLQSVPTTFEKYAEYVFDDPARVFETAEQELFEGTLDRQGRTDVRGAIEVEGAAPGRLAAQFVVKIFEPSGVFSTEAFRKDLDPYNRYVGIRVPKGDELRGMLLTDQDHAVRIALVDPKGNLVRSGQVQAEIYKIDWRWWWEKGDEDLAEFASSRSTKALKSDKVNVVNGEAVWSFRIKYPDWGRYLVRVRDLTGGHATGKVVYIDWPGWAGRSGESKIGATMLTLSADRPRYAPGDVAAVTFPSNAKGRALVTLEQKGRVLQSTWVQPADGTTRWQFTVTPDMAPNVYVHVTFLQPHLQTANDLPIRLYGVVPVFVEDPSTHLAPAIESADTFRPGEKVTVAVKEAKGREMTYTLALVDEGLLRLTAYQAPDPWNTFYRREASQLSGWDLYDFVAGAFAGKLESLLAVGGGDELTAAGERKANRFPPVVRFVGPVNLAKGATNRHEIELPQYVGAVRLMVVAGHGGAWGAAEKEVQVKSELMVLPTLPRVLSTGEDVSFPVTVFNMKDDLRSATVSVTTSGLVSVSGKAGQSVTFAKAEEKVVTFQLSASASTGVGTVRVTVLAGSYRAESETEIEVRMPVTRQTKVVSATVAAGKSWKQNVTLPGVAGTNAVQLEVSRLPPLDLGRSLEWLIRYPHGCVEQTTSAAFPQLYLDRLVKLGAEKAASTQRNIEAAILKLKRFQAPDGGFQFWPGWGDSGDWSTTYVGHFLLEAKARGFELPAELLGKWTEFQQERAEAWTTKADADGLSQSYRLYTLALAGSPSLGAMNRLREVSGLEATAKWLLASAYKLAGQKDEATRLSRDLGMQVSIYRALRGNYGSDLRDKAVILTALSDLGATTKADKLAVEVSNQLSSSEPYSTQTTAWALLALARYALSTAGGTALSFSYSWDGGKAVPVQSATPMALEDLAPGSATQGALSVANSGGATVYVRVVASGLPPLGAETASSNGLAMDVSYRDAKNRQVDPVDVSLASDVTVSVSVTNLKKSSLDGLALSLLLPGSWEPVNTRVFAEEGEDTEKAADWDYQDFRDDRIYTYFSLRGGEKRVFTFQATVTYDGKFYLPPVSVEAMYDPTINARMPGKWLDKTRKKPL